METYYIKLREHSSYPNFKSNKNIIQVVILEYCTLSKKIEVVSNQKLKYNNNKTYTSCNIKYDDINYINQIEIGKIYINNTVFDFQNSKLNLKLRVILPLSYYNNELPIKFECYEWTNYMKDSIKKYLEIFKIKIDETITENNVGIKEEGFFVFIKIEIAMDIKREKISYKSVLDKIEISKCKYEIKKNEVSENYYDIISSDIEGLPLNDFKYFDNNILQSIKINNNNYMMIFISNEIYKEYRFKLKLISKIIGKEL